MGYDPENQQTIKIVVTKEKYPILFEKKVKELVTECGLSEKDAEGMVEGMEFDLDLYYEIGSGLFAVETDAVESGSVISPYSGAEIVPFDLQDSLPPAQIVM